MSWQHYTNRDTNTNTNTNTGTKNTDTNTDTKTSQELGNCPIGQKDTLWKERLY